MLHLSILQGDRLRRPSVLFLLFVIFISSCKEESPLPSIQEQRACEKTETSVYSDGEKFGTTEHHYNDKRELVVDIAYDREGVKTDSIHYTYDDKGQVIRRYFYNLQFSIIQEQLIQYDLEGNEMKSELWINGKLSNRFEYFRASNGEIDSSHITSEDRFIRRLYSYADGELMSTHEYDKDGQLLLIKEYSYSEQSTVILTLNSLMEVIGKTEIDYDDQGRELEMRMYDAFNALMSSRSSEYDNRGNLVKVSENYVGFGSYLHETAWKCED